MKFNKQFLLYGYYLFILFAVLSIASCNVFKWANPQMEGGSSFDFTERGDRYYSDNNYIEALKSYSNAIVINPYNSKARLGYARSVLKYAEPDLVILLSKREISNSVDIVNLINTKDFKDIIIKGGHGFIFKDIINDLDSPQGVINDKGDKQISYDDMELNQLLFVSYFASLILQALDSDGDGEYATSNDYITVSNGTLALSVDPEKIISNAFEATNITTNTPIPVALSKLSNSHDSIEKLIDVGRFVYSLSPYYDKIVNTLVRPANSLKMIDTNAGYAANNGFNSLYDELKDASTNTNSKSGLNGFLNTLRSYKDKPENMGTNINKYHNSLVGVYAYNGSIGNFSFSPWNSHTNVGSSGGIKGNLLQTLILTSSTNNLTPDDVSNIIAQATNNISPQDISNFIGSK